MFCSLALSKKLSLIHGNFLIYQDVLHVAYYFFLKYIESYNNLDIKMKFHYMIRLMAVWFSFRQLNKLVNRGFFWNMRCGLRINNRFHHMFRLNRVLFRLARLKKRSNCSLQYGVTDIRVVDCSVCVNWRYTKWLGRCGSKFLLA